MEDQRLKNVLSIKEMVNNELNNTENICIRHERVQIDNSPEPIKIRYVYNEGSNRRVMLVNIRLGFGDSMDGEVYSMCLPMDPKEDKYCINEETPDILAAKLIPLTKQEAEKKHKSQKAWKELHVTRHMSKLVEKGICPNFQIYYAHRVCSKTYPGFYENDNIKDYYSNQELFEKIFVNRDELLGMLDDIIELKIFKEMKRRLMDYYDTGSRVYKVIEKNLIKYRYSERQLMLFVELADTDVSVWIREQKLSPELIMSMLFQIFAGLYSMHNNGFFHMDIHLGNVLVSKTKPGGYWIYKVKGKSYHVPNLGFQFKVWDFGRSHDIHHDSKEKLASAMRKNIDRFWEEEYYGKYISGVVNNLMNNKNRKAIHQLVASFDTFRVSHIIEDKIPDNPKYKKIAKMLDSIVYDTTTDFIESLSKKKPPKPLMDHPTIFKKFFSAYIKRPTKGDVLNEGGLAYNLDKKIEISS